MFETCAEQNILASICVSFGVGFSFFFKCGEAETSHVFPNGDISFALRLSPVVVKVLSSFFFTSPPLAPFMQACGVGNHWS